MTIIKTRALQMDIKIEEHHGFNEGLAGIIHALESEIFKEPYTKEKIRRESSVKPNLITLVASIHGEPAGYKVGYEMTSRLFYSWIGGVLLKYRGNGIARKLISHQHAIGKEQGYKIVRTHTENKYREMLLLNIRTGFDVVGVMNDSTKPKSIIVLDKILGSTQ